MNTSHVGMRGDCQVSSKELDIMVEIARNLHDIYDTRMTGGGFRSCTVNLVQTRYGDQFCTDISKQYQEHIGLKPEIYVCSLSDGVSEIWNKNFYNSPQK